MTIDTDAFGAGVGFEHAMLVDATHSESRCTAHEQRLVGPGTNVALAPVCASHRAMA